MNKPTLVLGATTNPERTAYQAIQRLHKYGHTVYAVGRKEGEVDGTPIQQTWPRITDIDTITLYLNASNQQVYYTDIINAHPKRVVFNPGTENPELEDLLAQHHIEATEACTLVLLTTGQY